MWPLPPTGPPHRLDRGVEGDADVEVETDPMTLASVIHGKRPVEAAATLTLVGDRSAFARFVGLFALPAKAGVE